MNKFLRYTFIFVPTFFLNAQQLENQVTGSSGEEFIDTQNNLIINQTTGEITGETISNSEITLTQGFQQTSQIYYIQPKAILQGAAFNTSNGLMRDDLRTGNYLPLQSPYNTNIETNPNTFSSTGNDAIVDWIEIELRNSNNRTITSKSALIQRDGDIVTADGTSPVQITTANSNYHIVLKHRNHLSAMSLNTIDLKTAPVSSLDFTNQNFMAFGTHAMTILDSGKFALWSGNVLTDSKIRYQGSGNDSNLIKDSVLANENNTSNSNLFSYFAYDNADVNLDGRIRYQGSNNDTNYIKDVIISHPNNLSSSNLFSITEQLPSQ